MTTDAKGARRYQAGVERALGLWDATNEWADYIAFLSRLGKALQTAAPVTEIPFKAIVATRLAQCLKPSLPSGVHQKALEVYGLIFALQGDALANDLNIWFPGLSHTLTFATLTTRPLLLALYEEHILRLSTAALRPGLRAIVLSLLPGIEEETSEDFERTLQCLNTLRKSFSDEAQEELFWQSLFLASTTSISRRAGALVYLTRYLPKLGATIDAQKLENGQSYATSDAIKAVTNPEPGLLVRCFATGLQDEQQLVQRGFLDLLVSNLPLHAPALQNLVSSDDLDILMSAALSVVLRRDMSLNRRLWTWLVGREDKREASTENVLSPLMKAATPTNEAGKIITRNEYFSTYGLASVKRSLERMLSAKSSAPTNRARPFRIMLSLMDRWVIGKAPVEALFIPAMLDLQQYQTTAPSQASFDEAFRSANVFFDAVEPQVLAGQLFRLVESEKWDLLEFIMGNFSLQEEDLVTIHLPMLCLAMSEYLDKVAKDRLPNSKRLAGILESMSNLLPPHATISNLSLSEQEISDQRWADRLSSLYLQSSYVKRDIFDVLPPAFAAQLLLRNVAAIMLTMLSADPHDATLDSICQIFNRAVSRAGDLTSLRKMAFVERLQCCLQQPPASLTNTVRKVSTIVRAIDTLASFDAKREIMTAQHLHQVVPLLIAHLWTFLLPTTPQYHVESVDQIWLLRSLSTDLELVDSQIAELMYQAQHRENAIEEQLARFSTLWYQTRLPEVTVDIFNAAQDEAAETGPWTLFRRPVLNIVDALEPSDPEDKRRRWISSLQSVRPIFRIIYDESRHGPSAGVSSLFLYRLHKLLAVSKLSNVLRDDFYSQAGFAENILDICMGCLLGNDVPTEVHTITLSILSLVADEIQITGKHDLVQLLIQQLSGAPNSAQSEILDLVLAIFSKMDVGGPPEGFLPIIMDGITTNDVTIDKWITLLCSALPLYPTQALYANLLRLTATLCDRAKAYFNLLEKMYSSASVATEGFRDPERSLNNLLAGLEYILARAHTHLVDRVSSSANQNPAMEKIPARSIANHRLTVILCMQDAIKLCGEIWGWRTSKDAAVSNSKSFAYISARLRNRTRRILEHLSDAEPQECLETLMGMWVASARQRSYPDGTLNLMQSLDGARPKFMMPATFNAIYNRTNPSALDQAQKSSLSVDINAVEVMAFLIAYIDALEDDLLEEIWTDCTAFLREVLGNPMPHRQVLLILLDFVAVLCQKMEKTNFGEVSRMRRELGDLCARLFTAILTIKPAGLDAVGTTANSSAAKTTRTIDPLRAKTALEALCEALPTIVSALGDHDRLNSTLTGVVTNITGPALRSKQFPQTVNTDILQLVLLIAKSQPNNKAWKKDVFETLNDSRFFQTNVEVARTGWILVLRQLCILDKSLIPDALSKIMPPSTAGIVFGVGASAARKEADWKTQLNLRRIAFLLLANDLDMFVPDLNVLMRKIEELLTATAASSPSSSTRGEVYLVLRAMVLAYSQNQLVSMWPMVDVELRELLTSMKDTDNVTYNSFAQLQAAKLLDLLLLLKPEEFQLYEWLFVTDTVDAIYPPHDFRSNAIADKMVSSNGREAELPSVTEKAPRKPWLCTEMTRDTEDVHTLLRPFFRQLSIHAFEDTYSLQEIDMEACRSDLLADLFVE
jgi:hypothetical protein